MEIEEFVVDGGISEVSGLFILFSGGCVKLDVLILSGELESSVESVFSLTDFPKINSSSSTSNRNKIKAAVTAISSHFKTKCSCIFETSSSGITCAFMLGIVKSV